MKPKFTKGDALLIVDPQNDFMPNGALAVPEGDKILPVVNQWIDTAQAENIPIFVSRDWHPKDHISFKEQGGIWPVHCVRNTKGATFHPDLHLPPTAIIADKAIEKDKEAYSAMQGVVDENQMLLPQKLRELKINRLWIAGLALDYCVQHSALEARQLGFEVHVILPGCRAIAHDTEQQAFQKMAAAGIVFENSADPYANT